MAKEIKMTLSKDVPKLGKQGQEITVTSDEQREYFETNGLATVKEETETTTSTSDGPIAEGQILPFGTTRQEVGTNTASSPTGVPEGQPLTSYQEIAGAQGNQNPAVGDNATDEGAPKRTKR